MHQIITADCLDWLKAQPTDSVDLIVGSPPYESRRTYGIGFNLEGQVWVDWMVERIVEMLRVSKGLVAMVVEGQTEDFRWSATPVLLMADLHRAGICLRKPPIYSRVGIPGSGGPDWFANRYEFVICCTKGGKLSWSNNTALGHPPKCPPGGDVSNRKKDGKRVSADGRNYNHDTGTHEVRPDGSRKRMRYQPPKKANPGNIIECHGGKGHLGSDLAHLGEAPFPEKLPEFFIRSCCPPCGTVCDPFGGSGTTMAVAVLTGRRSISIDIRPDQAELMLKRKAEAYERLKQRATGLVLPTAYDKLVQISENTFEYDEECA